VYWRYILSNPYAMNHVIAHLDKNRSLEEDLSPRNPSVYM
jgi:hypothetical protein